MERRFRSRYGRAAVVRAALVVFLLAGALIGAVVFTLDLNARRSNRQEVATELAGMARVSSGVPIDRSFLSVLESATPMPEHAALVLAQDGRVIAGGPIGANAALRHDRLKFGSVAFAAKAADANAAGVTVLALEPQSAVDARVSDYRRKLLFAAAITLALAAGLATRLARPVARVLGALAKLVHQAQTDALTNLANRRALDERLDVEVDHAHRLGTSVGFVIADIDNFKSINDRYGHQTGDEVLRQVARVFADSIRELDLAGRYGGEEIALVLPGTQLTGGRRLADRIRQSVEALDIT